MRLLSDKRPGFFRVDAEHILTENAAGFKAMRAKMAEHLKELATRYYAGDITVVDEFCQLYCLGENARKERARMEGGVR